MDFGTVRALVSAKRGVSPTLEELTNAFAEEDVREVGPPGRDSARSFAATLRVREMTTRNAGIDAAGFADAIAALARMRDDESIVLFHFQTTTRAFSVLLTDDGRIVGCIRVVTAGRTNPTEP